MIEVEFRARFNQEKFKAVEAFLRKHGKSLGRDDKDVWFFIMPDRLLKVVKAESKGTAKLSLKLNRIGNGAGFEEVELDIAPADFDKAVQLIKGLKLTDKVIREAQQRENFAYRDCEIALKYSKTWGYHLEIERMVTDTPEQAAAESAIRDVAEELGVMLMSEDELKAFVKKIEDQP